MKWSKFFLVLIVLLMTKMAFAGGDVQLNIKPPRNDGGLLLRYYRVEIREYRSDKWSRYIDFRAERLFGLYVITAARVDNLLEGRQYEFRARAINDAGVGLPGDVILSPTIKQNETIGVLDICSGEGVQRKSRSGSTFDISNLLFVNDAPNVQVPYRVKK